MRTTSPDRPDPAGPADAATPARRAGDTRNLLIATLAFGVCFYAWSLLGPLAPDLERQLGLSELQSAVMVAVPVLLGAILRVPFGLLADRHGGRRVFAILIAASIVPVAGLALLHSAFATILVLGLVLGIAGASFAVGVPLVNGWYAPERRGAALGLYGMGMGGTVVAALTAPRIADATSLTVPFVVAAVLLALVGLVFVAVARDAAPPAGGSGSLLAPLAVFRTSGRAWALTLFYFVAFGGFVAMFLYLPKLLTGVHELTKTDAGTRAAGFALLAVVGRPLGGWLADRLGAGRVLRGSLGATALLAVVLGLTYEQMLPLACCCLAIGLAFGLGTGAVFKLVAEWFPQEVGAVTGVVGAAGGLGGFFPPLVMGVVKGATGGYALGFVLLAVLAATALGVLLLLERPARREDGVRAGAAA
ncbi:MFS transporter [Patulibacter sp. SYSU D01012]|uniref:MFS transporter n=1 Tax=Patulibacter sp. SYSU D01012 TaxID=2817381 RepID=UPI001B318273|nr:MFS transporter [Patulibacter sp. SYSU D01012]